MSATLSVAFDEVNTLLFAAWEANVVPLGFDSLLWEDAGSEGRPSTVDGSGDLRHWGRSFLRHSDGYQATLSGASGTRRFRRIASLTVEINTRQADGRVVSLQAAQLMLTALEGQCTTSGVIFRNVRPLEIGQTGPWFRINVLANFEYDEVK